MRNELIIYKILCITYYRMLLEDLLSNVQVKDKWGGGWSGTPKTPTWGQSSKTYFCPKLY